jgi:hypothetical protein
MCGPGSDWGRRRSPAATGDGVRRPFRTPEIVASLALGLLIPVAFAQTRAMTESEGRAMWKRRWAGGTRHKRGRPPDRQRANCPVHRLLTTPRQRQRPRRTGRRDTNTPAVWSWRQSTTLIVLFAVIGVLKAHTTLTVVTGGNSSKNPVRRDGVLSR